MHGMKIYDGTGEATPARREETVEEWSHRRAVGVAEYAVSGNGTTLVTSGLGSCVAVGVTDGATVAGLVHVMLPSTDDRSADNPAKFADTGVETLVRALVASNANPADLFSKIAGGSEMITFRSQGRSIGERNVEAVRDALEGVGVPLMAEDVGGTEGRTVEFSSSGDLVVRSADAGERTL